MLWYRMTAYRTTHNLYLMVVTRNILKLHVDCVYILKDVIFIFGRFGLKLLIHARFWEFFYGGDITPK